MFTDFVLSFTEFVLTFTEIVLMFTDFAISSTESVSRDGFLIRFVLSRYFIELYDCDLLF